MSGQVPVFTVRQADVDAIRELIEAVTKRSNHTAVTVPAADFAAWLVAMGKEAFYTHMSANGLTWTRAGYQVFGDPTAGPMLSVTCDGVPAPWVTFPNTEGSRRFMFHYEMIKESE